MTRSPQYLVGVVDTRGMIRLDNDSGGPFVDQHVNVREFQGHRDGLWDVAVGGAGGRPLLGTGLSFFVISTIFTIFLLCSIC